jgi:hypothetical protein
VTIPFTPAWIKKNLKASETDLSGFNYNIRLFFRADGYALVQSQAFIPTKTKENAGQQKPDHPFFDKASEATVVKSNGKIDMDVIFQKSTEHYLRFIDSTGKPVADQKVSQAPFWAVMGDCSHLVGSEDFTNDKTDSEGKIKTDSGDVERVITIDDQASENHVQYSLNPVLCKGAELRFKLTGVYTTVELFQPRKIDVSIVMLENSKPMAKTKVYGLQVPCPCSHKNEIDELGTTDDMGTLELKGFYPDAYSKVFVGNKAHVEHTDWETDPAKWAEGNRVIGRIDDIK